MTEQKDEFKDEKSEERTFTQAEVDALIGKAKAKAKAKYGKSEVKKDVEIAGSDDKTNSNNALEEMQKRLEAMEQKEKQRDFKKALKKMNVPAEKIDMLVSTVDVSKVEDYDDFKTFAESKLSTPEIGKDGKANLKDSDVPEDVAAWKHVAEKRNIQI